ncbi:NHL repeat-containing protein [Muriicola sp.]|uniref:NHL repeat-containing protein n=1 Tax=Muriicola sp. TaxID=2020856 RepID=UPI003C774D1E
MKIIYKIAVVLAFISFSCSKTDEVIEYGSTLNDTISLSRSRDYTTGSYFVNTLAGSTSGYADGQGPNAQFGGPFAVAVDGNGNVYVADYFNHKIRKITRSGIVTTLAGSTQGFADGKSADAKFNAPFGIAVTKNGYVYVADTYNNKIRKITPNGIVSTLAGSTLGYLDGIPETCKFNRPSDVAIDNDGNVYVADQFNHRIRKIWHFGYVTTLAGSRQGFANGLGEEANFSLPKRLAVDTYGNVFVSDNLNNKIRKIAPNGHVKTIAGIAGEFSEPMGIAVDYKGVVYVGDNSTRIQAISRSGEVSNFAGSTQGNQDGNIEIAKFGVPYGLAFDSKGSIYVADANNHRIRKISVE